MSSTCIQQAKKCLANILTHHELNAFTATKSHAAVLEAVAASATRATGKCSPPNSPIKGSCPSTDSPLQGKLIAVKDNICTTDLPTTCASRTLDNHASPFAATVVTKLQTAGAVIHGKTNMDEFGMG